MALWEVVFSRFILFWLTALPLRVWTRNNSAETHSDDALFLLQMSSKHMHNSFPQRVIIPPNPDAMTFVGRHDVISQDNQQVVRFDALGFEMHFQVEGTTEVSISIAQQISGPGGWYFEQHEEELYEDGCWASSLEAKPSLVEGAHTARSSVALQKFGSQPHHFLVYVNGVPQIKPGQKCHICTFDTSEAESGQATEYIIASGLEQWKKHDIRIVKTSEPDFSTYPVAPNWLSLHALILDKGVAHSPATDLRTRKIEFVGDSWMAGFCNECNGGLCVEGRNRGSYMVGEDTASFRWGSYAFAWPQLLCEDMNAHCHSTILSGMGFQTACDPSLCSANQTLPWFWERTLASDPSSQWDFSAWIPDALVTLASINEHFEDATADKNEILNTYDKFMDLAFKRYPNVHVFLVCLDEYTAMGMCGSLKHLVNEKKDNGMQVDLLDVFHMPGLEDMKPCCGHPDVEGHKVIKDHVADEVRRIMGWHDAH